MTDINAGRLTFEVGIDRREAARINRETRALGKQLGRALNISGATKASEDDVQRLANTVRGLRNSWQATGSATAQTKRQLRGVRAEALRLRPALEADAKGFARLSVVARQATATLDAMENRMNRIGLASQVNLGLVRAFTGALATLGAGVGIYGLARVSDGLTAAAQEAHAARIALEIFNTELGNTNQSAEEGDAVLSRLADRFKVLKEDVADSASVLTRSGFTLEQLEIVLERVGASAIARGRTALEGFEALAQSVAGLTSAPLNNIGIAGNITNTFFAEYASSIGKAKDELTEFERAQAITLGIVKETNSELAALDSALSGVTESTLELELAKARARKEIGTLFTPAVVSAQEGLADLFNSLTNLLQTNEGVRAFIISLGVMPETLGLVGEASAEIFQGLGEVISGFSKLARGNLLEAFEGLEDIVPVDALLSALDRFVEGSQTALADLALDITDIGVEGDPEATFEALRVAFDTQIAQLSADIRTSLNTELAKLPVEGEVTVEGLLGAFEEARVRLNEAIGKMHAEFADVDLGTITVNAGVDATATDIATAVLVDVAERARGAKDALSTSHR